MRGRAANQRGGPSFSLNAGVGMLLRLPAPRRVAVLGLAVVAEGLTEVGQLGPLPHTAESTCQPNAPCS